MHAGAPSQTEYSTVATQVLRQLHESNMSTRSPYCSCCITLLKQTRRNLPSTTPLLQQHLLQHSQWPSSAPDSCILPAYSLHVLHPVVSTTVRALQQTSGVIAAAPQPPCRPGETFCTRVLCCAVRWADSHAPSRLPRVTMQVTMLTSLRPCQEMRRLRMSAQFAQPSMAGHAMHLEGDTSMKH